MKESSGKQGAVYEKPRVLRLAAGRVGAGLCDTGSADAVSCQNDGNSAGPFCYMNGQTAATSCDLSGVSAGVACNTNGSDVLD